MAAETISQKPYLLRAMHEWMTDTGQTPHIVIDVAVEGVAVPRQYVQDGKIVLNVSYAATHGLEMGNDVISFAARFAGSPQEVAVPIQAVLGIYSRETGQSMFFSEEIPTTTTGQEPAATDQEDNATPEGKKGPRSHLRVIK